MRVPPVALTLACLLAVISAIAADEPKPLNLFPRSSGSYGWELSEGKEYAGAKGILAPDPNEPAIGGKRPLRLMGDFSEGGGYVAATLKMPRIEPDELIFRLKTDTKPRLTVRIIDGTEQVHQYRCVLEDTGDWQTFRLQIRDLFEDQDAHPVNKRVQQAEHWGGDKDEKWHTPIKQIMIMLSKGNLADGATKGNLWIADPVLIPAVSSDSVRQSTMVELADFMSPLEVTWGFDNGREFEGATGSLTLIEDDADEKTPYLRLAGDFSEGGAYVQARRSVDLPADADIRSIRIVVRSENTDKIGVRLIDGGGQVHQHRSLKIKSTGAWQTIEFLPENFGSGDHWGGANNGEWAGGLKGIAILLNARTGGNKKAPQIDIQSVNLELAP